MKFNKKVFFSSIRFPFDVKSSPAYEITYFFSSWSSWFTAVAATGIGTIFFGLCFHISAQFEILTQQLITINRNLHEKITSAQQSTTSADRKLSKEQNSQLNDELKIFIHMHNETTELCELISRTFTPIILFHFLVSAFLICVSCLMPFIAADAEKMSFLGFAISGFVDIFLHSYSGHCIIKASTRIKDEAYEINWYDCDIRNQKLILMIMKRAQKASAINIPFVTLSLETFVKVWKVLVRIFWNIQILISCRWCKLLDLM